MNAPGILNAAKSIALFLAVAVPLSVIAATTAVPVPLKRTTLPAITFAELEKKIAFEIAGCNRLHGVMTKIKSATMQGNTVEIIGDASRNPIDSYPMKPVPTPEQLQSLKGKPICDPN
jgi:hypothetical protein